jgi:hypothetical protein
MSLCLMLLLAVIAINWWHGWKPFTHPFQMPGKQWLKRLSTIHSQRWRSISCPGAIVDAREPPSTLLGGSHQQPGIRLQGRADHSSTSRSSSKAASRESRRCLHFRSR